MRKHELDTNLAITSHTLEKYSAYCNKFGHIRMHESGKNYDKQCFNYHHERKSKTNWGSAKETYM